MKTLPTTSGLLVKLRFASTLYSTHCYIAIAIAYGKVNWLQFNFCLEWILVLYLKIGESKISQLSLHFFKYTHKERALALKSVFHSQWLYLYAHIHMPSEIRQRPFCTTILAISGIINISPIYEPFWHPQHSLIIVLEFFCNNNVANIANFFIF